jgi:hypothetical protein
MTNFGVDPLVLEMALGFVAEFESLRSTSGEPRPARVGTCTLRIGTTTN